MNAKIITYTIKHLTIAEQNQLRKELNGHNDTSHGGQYKYRRKGILDKIIHIKPSKGTIIAPIKESQKIINMLKKHKAEIRTINIKIAEKEFKK